MMTATVTQPQPETVKAGAGAAPPPPRPIVPFVRAAIEHVEQIFDQSQVVDGNTHVITGGPIDVNAYGYMRSILLVCQASGGTGTAAVYQEDAPWSAISQVLLSDVNGTPIVNLTGYQLYLANLFGGYCWQANPTSSPYYVAPPTSGNFAFSLRVPVELGRRDALGALPNTNASATYKLTVTQAASTAIFSTPSTTLPTLRWRGWLEAWSQPAPDGVGGAANAVQPNGLGTTGYWSATQVSLNSGQNTVRFPRVGLMIRNLLLVWRNATPARADSTFPASPGLFWDTHPMWTADRDTQKLYAVERFGYAAPTGVFPVTFTHDLAGHGGDEMRDLWVPTTQSTRLELQGDFTANGTLTIITNDVAPVGNVYFD